MMNPFARRVPFVPQMETAECGAACLAMLLGYFGRHVPLPELRVDCGVSRDGVSAEGVARAAERHGLTVKALALDLEELGTVATPLIAHWDFNHFIVIERVTRRGAVALDPALGRKWLSWAELDHSFTGVALTFSPGPGFRERAASAASLARYWALLCENARAVGLVMLAAVFLQLLVILFPSASQVLIDHVLPAQRVGWLWAILAAVLVASVSRVVLTWVRGRTLALLYMMLDVGLMSRFADKLFRLPMVFFDQRSPGDLLHRVEANAQLSAFGARFITAMLDLLVVVALGVLMFLYHPPLALLSLLLAAARILLVGGMRGQAKQVAASELALRGRETNVAVDALSIPEVVRAFGIAGSLGAKHTNSVIRRSNMTLALRRHGARVVHLSTLLDGVARALVIYVGGFAVLEQRMSIGAFVGFLALQGMLTAPLTSVVQAATQLSYVRGLLARMSDVLDAEPEPRGTEVPWRVGGAIELVDVSYRYAPGAPDVCQRVSLRIAPGERVAIVGRSGAGKSTLAKLLAGLVRPTQGEVRLDGVSIEQLDLDVVRRRIGVVLQDPFLFDDSVQANLDLAQQGLSAEALRRALRLACIDDVVDALPEGLRTRVGERGRRLSGGQRQRLVLARALASDPAILLLDEATSSLDLPLEARLHESLSRLGCTRIVIAHRLATVRDADRVLVMDEGRLVQEGTYQALSSVPGHFRELAGGLA
jgi:ATP-binding cassette subfamily B protein